MFHDALSLLLPLPRSVSVMSGLSVGSRYALFTRTHRQPCSKRKTSVKVRAIGIFPGAKVVRGKDWQWGDQDGGQGSEGEVKGYGNVISRDSARNRVQVEWPSGVTHGYRLGDHGNVDVTCVEEEVGPFYYRDHLPLLGECVSKVVLTLSLHR